MSTPGGMITLVRENTVVRIVTWGNADVGMRQAWNALTWAYAEAGGGIVVTDAGRIPAQEYRRREALPF